MRHSAATIMFVLGCMLGVPPPECPTPATDDEALLTCEAAVRATRDSLPPGHPSIDRIQFLHGSAIACCSHLYGLQEPAPINGYVVFTYSTGAREYVDVSLLNGALNVGEPMPYGDVDP